MTTSFSKSSVQTFGCRLNIWESEVIKRHMDDAALTNAVIINTCAVTAEAEKQARQAIRKTRRDNPDARIVVTGCAAQIAPDIWQNMAEVDAVIGNHDKLEPETWRRLAGVNHDELPSVVGDIMTVQEVAPHLLEGFDAHTRAFLQIQQGCDHRCTFCIIPYGRGNSRSVPMQVVIDQVKRLADNGVAEVVLTGVDVTSWGHDLEGTPRLGQLIRRLLRSVPALKRLRMSSIDPAEVDPDMLAALAEDDRLMPHLHLSVQHGDDLILKRMKRRHLRDDVLRVVDEVRATRPDVVFGADMIAGFPTEDEAAHQASLELITEAGLTWLHVFPYSPREGTPAEKMPQQDGGVIKSRAAELRQAAAKAEAGFLQTRIGTMDEVLVETGGIGHSRQFAKVKMDKPGLTAGEIYRVKVVGASDTLLDVELT
ncbi:MAG: tRNA (N(6)-L-threonylcarbamoyladenosine(37)-C(2))-methylthiotransferase MtaB [Alphaproteobacteria bacterium]|nr:tRNA (N(6)-L-threonylcarbamoyladenosine(37)-C(2))-methylthiotransferase MtaB [Alphaproteobacteria bacterium]